MRGLDFFVEKLVEGVHLLHFRRCQTSQNVALKLGVCKFGNFDTEPPEVSHCDSSYIYINNESESRTLTPRHRVPCKFAFLGVKTANFYTFLFQ